MLFYNPANFWLKYISCHINVGVAIHNSAFANDGKPTSACYCTWLRYIYTTMCCRYIFSLTNISCYIR